MKVEEKLKEQIMNFSTEELAEFMLGYGKCHRCANFYIIKGRDKPSCFRNLRNSSCKKGIMEYLISEVKDTE